MKYDGTNPDLPIYVAVNGSIFDVSVSAHTYGPGGSYHFFAGHDATRAYVTGCFSEDITPDLRGVEEMFIPLPADPNDPEERKLTNAQKKIRAEREKRQAREKVYKGVKHWEDFYTNSDKYHKVGRVVREEGWLEKLPKKKLCEKAQKSRPKRDAES